MKYIDADKLKSEIQSLIDLGYDKLQGNLYHVLSLIDSLQQKEPDKDLEEAAKEYEFSCYQRTCFDPEHNWPSTTKDSFKAGAEWQKEQMLKEAVEGMIYQPAEHYWAEVIARYDGELKHGDKVRIIILPKEDGQ